MQNSRVELATFIVHIDGGQDIAVAFEPKKIIGEITEQKVRDAIAGIAFKVACSRMVRSRHVTATATGFIPDLIRDHAHVVLKSNRQIAA